MSGTLIQQRAYASRCQATYEAKPSATRPVRPNGAKPKRPTPSALLALRPRSRRATMALGQNCSNGETHESINHNRR